VPLLALGSAALAVPPATAAPTVLTCPRFGAHQIRFVTAKQFKSSHDCGAPAPGDFYQGWIGINGQITTPTELFGIRRAEDMVMGSIAMIRYAPDGGRTAWIRAGWYTGGHPACGPTFETEYRLFIEYSSDNGRTNHCFTPITLGRGEKVIYRIQRHTDDPTKWDVFYNYNQLFKTIPGMPVAMTAEVGEFLQNESGQQRMPRTYFGDSDPDTNNAIRLLGSNGYEPWDMTLTAGATFVQDEREGIGPHFIISAYAPYYHAVAYTD
jgi:hypothetical protein